MNDSDWKRIRERRKNLLIVEGNHEKNELFGMILKCFPEIDIDDVWIYGTNIYMGLEYMFFVIADYNFDW